MEGFRIRSTGGANLRNKIDWLPYSWKGNKKKERTVFACFILY